MPLFMIQLFTITLLLALLVIYTNQVIVAKNRFNRLSLQHEAELLRRMVESIESEQNRIAQDLHDNLGPLLSVLKIKHEDFEKILEKDEQLKKSYLTQVEIIDTVSREIRDTCHNLSSSILMKSGLDVALEQFVLSLDGSTPFDLYGFEHQAPKNSDSWEISMYRVITELINNALKHSGGNNFRLSKIVMEGKLIYRLAYENGIGLTNESYQYLRESSKSIGLKSIHDRLAYMRSIINFQVIGEVCSVEIEYQINESKN